MTTPEENKEQGPVEVKTQVHSELEKTIVNFISNMDKSSFSAKDKIFFYKQLVYMLKGWVSILQAVDTIRRSTSDYALKTIATSLAYYLNEGKSFSYAIGRLPEYFDESDSAIIKTWESTGNLDVVLQELADEYEYINTIKNKYKSALTYPCILIVIAVAAVLYLFSSVLPNILDMFADQMDKLPVITRVLKSISDFCMNYRQTILIVMATVWIVLGIYWTTEHGKKTFSTMMLTMPLVGKMTKTYYLIKWAKYMRLMIWSWLDYLQTFRLLRGVLDVPAYQEMIENTMAGLQIGKTIYSSLENQTHLIYPNVAVMIKVWEETARLEDAMQNIINMYQEELDTSISQFSKLLEPIILIVMWVVVALVASGIFGVVFAVMEDVSI